MSETQAVTEVSEKMLQDILARLEQTPMTEEQIRLVIDEHIRSFMNGEEGQETVRKIRFGSDPEPRLAGSKFGRFGLSLGDIEHLYDIVSAAQRLNPGQHKGPSEELTNAFNDLSKAQYLTKEEIKELDYRLLADEFVRVPRGVFNAKDQAILSRGGSVEDTQLFERAVRAHDTAETGYGLQLVGNQYVGELWQSARFESRVFGTIRTQDMTAPTTFVPVEADLPEMLFVPESTANNSSNYDTSKTGSNRVQLDAKKFVIHQMWSGEMEEDSLIPYVPYLRMQVVKSLAHYSDSAVINGDTTNTATGNINLDDADPADTKHYLAWDGIRHVALVDNTDNGIDHAGAAVTYKSIANLLKEMVDTTYLMDWGHPTDASDVVFVADPFTSDAVRQLDEVINWSTQQGLKLLNAQTAAVFNHPFINGSMALSLTEADGKVSTTGSNNTQGQVVVYNRRAFVAGWRRRVRVELERLPATDQTRMVHSLRMGFGRYSPSGAASGIQAAAKLYNIGL
jgi:HK97 family phage major capsid protein